MLNNLIPIYLYQSHRVGRPERLYDYVLAEQGVVKQVGLYLYQKSPLSKLYQCSPLSQSSNPPEFQALIPQKRYRIDLGHPDRVVILLAGCGGTGGFAAHILAQLARWALTAGLDLRLYFIDPDVVEEKNLVRQNFCPAEVGQPKAFTLAWRYTAAFGLNIIPVIAPFAAEMLTQYKPKFSPQGSLMIVVGAVDNVCARRDMAQALTTRLKELHGTRDRLWWLDGGNEQLNGQVLLGNSLESEPLLSPLGFCTGLPLPHIQEPSLLQDRPRPATDPLSCAELTALGEQSAMVNRAMATWLGIYLYRLLQSRDLDLRATYLNLRTGTTRSTPITTGRVIFPERPRQPAPSERPDEMADQTCPDCGAEVIAGEDEWQGVLVHVRFCADCAWREECCPQCDGEIGQEEDAGLTVLRCWDCGWQAEEETDDGHH